MGRWEPGASGRLRTAAVELFVERGYEQTTVADIAARAGLTARTFFRYFSDKREVLFDGGAELERRMVAAVLAAPADAGALPAVAAALHAAADLLGERGDFAATRAAIISANAELRERELIKLETLQGALTAALLERPVPPDEASLAAATGLAVFRVAFARWVADPHAASLDAIMTDCLSQLQLLAGSVAPARSSVRSG